MTAHAKNIRDAYDAAKQEHDRLKRLVDHLESTCTHMWGEPERTCDRFDNVEGNIKWTRICEGCGKTQTTHRYKEKTIEFPIW